MPDDPIASLRVAVSADLSELQDQLGQIPGLLQQSISDFGAIGGAAEEASTSLTSAGDSAADAGEKAHSGGLEFLGLGENLTKLAEEAGIAFSAYEVLKNSFEDFAVVQKASIALTQMTADAHGTEEAIQGLKDTAVTFGLPVDELIQADQKMVSFGIDTKAIPALMQGIIDASAATGNSFDAVANATERMALSGVANARQLTQMGINTGDLAAALNQLEPTLDATASNASKVFKALGEGGDAAQATAERVEVLTAALEKHAGAGAAVAESLSNQWQTAKTELSLAFESIGAALEPVATAFLKFVTFMLNGLPTLVGWIQAIFQPVSQLWGLLSKVFDPGSLGAALYGGNQLGPAAGTPLAATGPSSGASLGPGNPNAPVQPFGTGLGISLPGFPQSAGDLGTYATAADAAAKATAGLASTAVALSDSFKAATQPTLDQLTATEAWDAGLIAMTGTVDTSSQSIDTNATSFENLQGMLDLAGKSLADWTDQTGAALQPTMDQLNATEEWVAGLIALAGHVDSASQAIGTMTDATSQAIASMMGITQATNDAWLQCDTLTNSAGKSATALTGMGTSGHNAATQIVNSISRDLGNALAGIITGSESVSKAFDTLGKQVLSTILDHIIKEGLDVLLSKLTSVIPMLGNLGLGGGGGNVAGGGGVLGSGVGAGIDLGQGAASAGGAAASGLSGTLGSVVGIGGLVEGAISAVTGVISNVQQATANDTLWRIMSNTLGIFYAMIGTGGLVDSAANLALDFGPGGTFQAFQANQLWPELVTIEGDLKQLYTLVGQNQIIYQALQAIDKNTSSAIKSTGSTTVSPGAVIINASGMTGQQIAEALATYLGLTVGQLAT